MHHQAVLDFWFAPEQRAFWFQNGHQLDAPIKTQFFNIHQAATQGELWQWRQNPEGRLAEIIVLDQFSRHLYRDHAHAFTQDPMALALAQEAVQQQLDQQLNPEQRHFLYMPFMHSESAKVHQFALMLFQRLNNPTALDFEKQHKVIIDRFGRYPHRNEILGRASTAEELEFLTQPHSRF